MILCWRISILFLSVFNIFGDQIADFETSEQYVTSYSQGDGCHGDRVNYSPGGREVEVQSTEPPEISLEKVAFSSTVGNAEKATSILNEAQGIASEWDKVNEFAEKAGKAVTKWGSRLGKSLGMIGAIFSIIESETSLSPEDVAERTNNAFKEMARKLDKRMSEMKGYVDFKVIELHKVIISSDLNVLQSWRAECLLEEDFKALLQCVTQASRFARFFAPKFMEFEQSSEDKNLVLQPYQIKKLEMEFLILPSYVSTCLSILTDTANVLELKLEDSSSGCTTGGRRTTPQDTCSYNKGKLHTALRQKIEMAERFIKYARWGVRQIVKVHTDNTGANCRSSIECHPTTFNTNDVDLEDKRATECTCTMSPVLAEPDKCSLKILSSYYDGHDFYKSELGAPLHSYIRNYFVNPRRQAGSWNRYDMLWDFHATFKERLEKFWKKKITDYSDLWWEARQAAIKKLEESTGKTLDKIKDKTEYESHLDNLILPEEGAKKKKKKKTNKKKQTNKQNTS